MILFSNNNIDSNLSVFISWIQISKCDFAFIDFYNLRKIIGWHSPSENLQKLYFKWNSVVTNYLWLTFTLFILSTAVILIKFINTRSLILSLKYYTELVRSPKISWWFFYLVSMFLIINIISDISNVKNHYALTFILMCSLICLFVFSIVTRISFLLPSYISLMDPDIPTVWFYLYGLQIWVLWFLFEIKSTYSKIICLCLILIINFIHWIYMIMRKINGNYLEKYAKRQSSLFWFLIWWIICLSQFNQSDSSTKSLVLIITTYFVITAIQNIAL